MVGNKLRRHVNIRFTSFEIAVMRHTSLLIQYSVTNRFCSVHVAEDPIHEVRDPGVNSGIAGLGASARQRLLFSIQEVLVLLWSSPVALLLVSEKVSKSEERFALLRAS